jgi:hypothetical protein
MPLVTEMPLNLRKPGEKTSRVSSLSFPIDSSATLCWRMFGTETFSTNRRAPWSRGVMFPPRQCVPPEVMRVRAPTAL